MKAEASGAGLHSSRIWDMDMTESKGNGRGSPVDLRKCAAFLQRIRYYVLFSCWSLLALKRAAGLSTVSLAPGVTTTLHHHTPHCLHLTRLFSGFQSLGTSWFEGPIYGVCVVSSYGHLTSMVADISAVAVATTAALPSSLVQ